MNGLILNPVALSPRDYRTDRESNEFLRDALNEKKIGQ
jgi:hypothetical protein